MSYIRLTVVAHALASNTVSGMAQRVGLHWPPPPSISVRNLVRLAGGQVSALNWLPANPFAILIDSGQNAWHAGHINDVLALDSGGLVLGTDSGGVWLVEGNNSAVPLSEGWDTPNISCLAFGPDGPLHIFAGTDNAYSVALFETDTSNPFPLLNWRPVPLTPMSPGGATVGTINRMVVLKQRRRIVLACDNGVFWSSIPTSGNAYSWQQVPNLPQGGYSGLAIGPNDRIVIAAWGANPNMGLFGIFYADWSAAGLLLGGSLLHLATALGSNTVSGMAQKEGLKWPPPPAISVRNLLGRARLPPSQAGQNPVFGWGMGRTSLASSAQDPRVMYAVSAATDQTIYAVLASSDGGETWTQVTIPNSSIFPGIPFHQGNYNNCLAISPFDSEVVALGWQKHFVSRDSGMSWQLFDSHAGLPGLHDDIHAVYFDPTSPPNERLYVCSDGGVALTVDRGQTFASDMNKNLLNLQIGRTSFTPNGRLSVSYQTPGLVAGATQDNGNLFSIVGANATPWTQMEGGDGRWVMFVGTGELLHYYQDQPDGMLLHVAQWDGTKFNDVGLVSSNGLPDIPHAPVCAIVNTPLKRNAAGQLMWAVAAGDSEGNGVYGIFADSQGAGMHYELLGRIPTGLFGPITALGSADGGMVFVGQSGGLIYAINTDQQTIQQLTVVPLRNSSQGDAGASVDRIVVLSNNLAFAILSNSQFAPGNFILHWDGVSWNAVGVGKGLPGDQFAALETTNPKPLFTLFAATDKQVFESDDNGDTWQAQSGGLPTRPHCTDLRFVTEPTGARFLYLSTYGRSVWRASLDAPM